MTQSEHIQRRGDDSSVVLTEPHVRAIVSEMLCQFTLSEVTTERGFSGLAEALEKASHGLSVAAQSARLAATHVRGQSVVDFTALADALETVAYGLGVASQAARDASQHSRSLAIDVPDMAQSGADLSAAMQAHDQRLVEEELATRYAHQMAAGVRQAGDHSAIIRLQGEFALLRGAFEEARGATDTLRTLVEDIRRAVVRPLVPCETCSGQKAEP